MNAHDFKNRYGRALAWGALCGLRSMSGPALASHGARHGSTRGLLQRQLAKPTLARTVRALAVAELIADKLPFIPARIALPSLLFRAASGAISAVTADASGHSRLGLFRRRRSPFRKAFAPALAGAAAAVASASVAYSVRRAVTRRFQLSSLAGGLLEDAVLLLAASRLRP
ncbi:MAG TPA: hypothetical protein VG963_11935 [Polyangiaceae bacterium]|nr:hypothetical protein [Polyangiaceae bacterium]